MDMMRRGALMRAGKMIAGAAGAAALGRGQSDIAWGNGINVGYKSYPKEYPTPVEPDPAWARRNAACKPLYAEIEKLESSRRWNIGENAYLDGLKSVSNHWKHGVMLEREKRRQTAIQSLHEQIQKLMQSPMDKLEEIANQALAGFMAEWNKP